MATPGMIVVRLVRPAVEYAASRGMDRLALYRVLGVTPQQALEPERWVTVEAMFSVFELCMRTLKNPAFPLKVAQLLEEADYHVLGFAVASSRNVREALARVARYSLMLSFPGRWVVDEQEGDEVVRVEWQRELPLSLGHRIANECTVAELLSFFRYATASNIVPLRACFRHPAPNDIREHERLFGKKLVFGDTWDGLLLPRSLMELVPRTANPPLAAYLDTQLQRAVQAIPGEHGIVDRVRVLLSQALASGEPGVEDIARQLHVSERTLRRELTEAGTGFRELVEQVRRERAQELLQSGRASLTEVAFLLGFSDASAFSRAFKRWHGVPPGEFVRQQ